jgi:hypothetical protein
MKEVSMRKHVGEKLIWPELVRFRIPQRSNEVKPGTMACAMKTITLIMMIFRTTGVSLSIVF